MFKQKKIDTRPV